MSKVESFTDLSKKTVVGLSYAFLTVIKKNYRVEIELDSCWPVPDL